MNDHRVVELYEVPGLGQAAGRVVIFQPRVKGKPVIEAKVRCRIDADRKVAAVQFA